MNKTLITGATGFLGKHLVDQLIESGEAGNLRLFCREEAPVGERPGVEVVRGDITSAEDVSRAVDGCSRIYHLAGFVSRDPKHAARLHDVHVGGTRNICEAALRHGVEKMVLVSSSGTVAVSRNPVVHDEESGFKYELVYRWPYYLSKVFAEKTALWFHREARLPVVIANPALLLGPGDETGSSTGDVALFLRGQVLSMPLGGMSFVDARDAAAGLIGTMHNGRLGERYLLGGPNWTFRSVVECVAEMTGLRPPIFSLSPPVARFSGQLGRKLLPLVGRSFEMDDATIEMSAYFWYCNSAKAAAELGFRTRDAVQTLRETVEDLRRRGL